MISIQKYDFGPHWYPVRAKIISESDNVAFYKIIPMILFGIEKRAP